MDNNVKTKFRSLKDMTLSSKEQTLQDPFPLRAKNCHPRKSYGCNHRLRRKETARLIQAAEDNGW